MLNGFIPFWGFVRQFLKAEINFWHQISSLSRKLPIKCRFQNRCREYVRDPHPNQKKTRQPMPACRTSKVWLLPEVSKKNGQNFQGFKVSYASTSPSFLPSRLAFWSFCSFRNVWPLRVAVSSCSNRKEKWPNCADGFSYQLDDFEMKTPPFLESENPVSKIFGGFLKTYRKTIHVEMLTSWYTWNLKHLFINGCFTKHPLKTGCLGYQGTRQPYPISTFWTYAVLTVLARDLPLFLAVADRCSSRFLVAADVAWKARQEACVASIQGSHEDDSSWQFWAVLPVVDF